MRIADDATKAALGRFKQWNDEIVTGMKPAFGEELAIENVPNRTTTGTTSKTESIDDLLNAPLEARRAGDPPSGTPEHKELRWQQYQDNGGELEYEVWSKKYEVNMQQARIANARVDDFHQKLGWGQREVTVEAAPGVKRRLDIADQEMNKGIEHKTGKQYLDESNQWELERDQMLVKKGWDIEWHFEGTASKPLLEALEKAGIRHNLGDKK